MCHTGPESTQSSNRCLRMNYLQLNRSSIIYRQIAVKTAVSAVLGFFFKTTHLFWTSLEGLQGGISLQAAWQERKVPEKGATQLGFCPQLPLSEILKASMSFTQVFLMHWGTSPHRTLIVPKAVSIKSTMAVQFESRSRFKRSSYSGWFERASLASTEAPEVQGKIHSSHCFLHWGMVVHH